MYTMNTIYKGINVVDANISIGIVTINADHKSMVYNVLFRASNDQSLEPFESIFLTADYDSGGSDPITQAYDNLKSIEKFATMIEIK